ncbi:gamma-glutamylcyclotransferase [Elizabethkingia anophelis]|nr:gamma-glutamylcyclotransferase [Elizabethkingia anophelis]MCT4182110.1 gamma-glutamylcyclotransferase [Elizabethkingia anophelis]MCT4272296.1 gamma-glutamylcyclotransferase [Elizabethkingia anophelis]MCT4289864.1 gamma-glutamylcyclotransferase [Elizabethkingia anophelis]
MKIFAYGSNMNLDRLKERVPSANKLFNVFIKGYTIKCNKVSTDGSSKANIIKTDNDDDIVWGVIFEIDDSEKSNLDEYEQGYNDSILSFLDSENNPHEAQVYIADESAVNEELLPYDWYKEYIVSGAKENNLPKEYIEKLEAIKFIEDSNIERRDKNLSILKKTETLKTPKKIDAQSTMLTMNKGSEWRKWNFHVHTKGTNKNDQFTSATMDDFFYTFFKGAYNNQVSAIGVTDYFSIDRYLDAVKYREEIDKKKDSAGKPLFEDEEIKFIKSIFLFPNVELRMLPSTDKGRLINIHCLFNPNYVADLENDFFSNIENQDNVKMNRYGIINYGKSLDSSITHEHKQYEKGIDNFVIDLRSLKKLLHTNKKFKENTLLIVSNSNQDGASAIQKHYDLFENEQGNLDGLRQSIYYVSDGIFSANPKDIKYFVGKRLEGTQGYDEQVYKKEVKEVIEKRGSLKPCIVGCDAHNEEGLFKKFTWVKAELNFEGLRQICLEPEHRVKIDNDKPDFKEEKLLIDKVKFLSPGNVFSTAPIYLNPNLNVIIGGKSSGKSILLYAIAKTLSTDETVLKNDDGSFKYDFNEIENGFDFEITTKGGFNQKLNRDKDENSILPEIKYIPQSYLVKLAEPELNKKGKSLNKLVRDLIKEDDVSKESYQNFINKVQQNDKLRNAQIDLFFETSKEIKDLDVELKTKSNRDVLEHNIKANSEKVEELNKSTGLTQTQVEEYKKLQEELNLNSTKRQSFGNDLSAITTFNTELKQVLSNLKQKKDSLLKTIQLSELKELYENEYSEIDTLFEKAKTVETSFQTEVKEGIPHFTNDSLFKELFNSIDEERQKLDDSIKPYLRDDKVKLAIVDLNKSIKDDKNAIADIDNINKKIQEKKKLLNEAKDNILKIYGESYNEYISIIDNLKSRTHELEKDGLNIVGKAQYNFKKLRESLWNVSDGRSASYNQYPILDEAKKATDKVVYQDVFDQIKKLFEDVISGHYILTSKASVSEVVKLVLDDHFFDYWEITYKKDKLGQMSTGKASFVILMLIIGLSKSKSPILIDQPEDNLDNRSITTDLVNYLRNKKLERQIIIVTHNANIVVNADAENVIVANQKGQSDESSTSIFKFDYINGAIENSFERKAEETDILKSMGIRQHIADIVEGGKEAFIMREKKYRFH